MKMTADLANKVFDILEKDGNHEKSYIDCHRDEFVDKMTTGYGSWEHWYSTDSGSSIKVYFRTNGSGQAVFTVDAQTINDIHEPTLVDDVSKALNDLTSTITPEYSWN